MKSWLKSNSVGPLPQSVALGLFVSLCVVGCASQTRYLPGTVKVKDTTRNREVIGAVEKYRLAVERKDVEALALMTSKHYVEDRATPEAKDDYGYKTYIREVLRKRFARAFDIRYSLQYRRVRHRCRTPGDKKTCQAFVDVLVDASWTVMDRGAESRKSLRDHNQLVLVWEDERWKFLSGK